MILEHGTVVLVIIKAHTANELFFPMEMMCAFTVSCHHHRHTHIVSLRRHSCTHRKPYQKTLAQTFLGQLAEARALLLQELGTSTLWELQVSLADHACPPTGCPQMARNCLGDFPNQNLGGFRWLEILFKTILAPLASFRAIIFGWSA